MGPGSARVVEGTEFAVLKPRTFGMSRSSCTGNKSTNDNDYVHDGSASYMQVLKNTRVSKQRKNFSKGLVNKEKNFSKLRIMLQ